MSMHMMKSDQGCGCGGGSDGGCGCGSSGGDVCSDVNFKRPRFFAGQLLTEDDLQALTDYVVGKNRMHNRFLWGDGVVCGLSVTCEPCEEGSVSVAPGYALDCCGNDIMVPCKETVDLKALLRDLRKRQLAGYDCGDPCDDGYGDVQSYGLYLTYTETLEDPVAPFASGDPCGQQACEPTRVCEGYKFELRCDCATSDGPDVWKRIKACIGDLRQAGMAVSKAQSAQVQAEQILKASSILQAEKSVPFDNESLDFLVAAPALLQMAEVAEIEAEDGGDAKLPDELALRREIAQLQLVTGAVTRLNLTPDFKSEGVDIDEVTKTVRDAGMKASARIAALGPRILSTPAARAEAEDTVRLAQKFLAEELPEEQLSTVEARMVALNAPVSVAQLSRLQIDASLLRDWLLDRLGKGGNRTRCDLYERLRCIRITPPTETSSNLAEPAVTAGVVIELLRILLEYLIDCICLALNPPCQPCDDKGVLLACVKIRDCEVVDICNMSRRHVLTPVAMRYWLPPIKSIGKLVEKFCCEFDVGKLFRGKEKPKEKGQEIPLEDLKLSQINAQPIVASMAPIVSALDVNADDALLLERFSLTPADLENVSTFSSNLALLTGRTTLGTELRARSETIGSVLQDRASGLFAPKPVGGDMVFQSSKGGQAERAAPVSDNALEKRIGTLVEKRVAENANELRAELGDEIGNSVAVRLTEDIPSLVTAELTAGRLRHAVGNSSTVKELKADNERLTSELKALSKAVKALQAGGNA